MMISFLSLLGIQVIAACGRDHGSGGGGGGVGGGGVVSRCCVYLLQMS